MLTSPRELHPVLVFPDDRRNDKPWKYKGRFHCFSTYTDSDGSEPVAIVEDEYGNIHEESPSGCSSWIPHRWFSTRMPMNKCPHE